MPINIKVPKLAPPEYSAFIEDASTEVIASVEEQTGLKILHKPSGVSGWMNLDSDVEEHVDEYGRTFVFCAKGAGILWLDDKPIHLSKGFAVIINDHIRHSFELITKRCVLFVALVKGRVNEDVKNSPYFLGEKRK